MTGTGSTSAFTYSPAPESRAVVDLKPSYGLFIDGAFVDTLDGSAFKTVSPSTEEVLAEVTEAGPRDVDRAVAAARAAYDGTWSRLSGRERGKYLFRIARILQERGPRVRRPRVPRQRQADQGVARRRRPPCRGSLLLPRRLGRQAGPRGLRALAATARGGRAGHPVELPAAHAGVEDRTGARRRQHGRAQARRDDAAHRAAVRGGLPAGRPPAGRREHRHRRRGHRPGPGRARRRRQGRVHRLHRRRQADPPFARRQRQEAHARARRQGRQHRLRRRARRPGRRGHRPRRLLQPGTRLLRRHPAARPGVGRRRGPRLPQAPPGHAAPRRPAGQEHRHRRHQLRRAARAHPHAVRHRRGGRGRSGGPRRASSPIAASGSPRRSSPASRRPTASPARRSSGRSCPC